MPHSCPANAADLARVARLRAAAGVKQLALGERPAAVQRIEYSPAPAQ
jgi:hypothetical protein